MLETNVLFPSVSILLPVRNEGKHIEETLQGVLCQDYPGEKIQVIVADGMSDDETSRVIRKYQYSHPELILIANPGKIVPTGLNAALRVARGEVIVRVDGHTKIAPDYVRRCVQALQMSGAQNVGGKMRAIGEGKLGETIALATSSPFGVGGARFHYSDQEEWVDTVYLGAWPRQIFSTIGLFDEELVRDQDDEFNYRLREHAGKILLSPNIHSEYVVRSRPGALWRQYYQYGYWKVRVLQKHPLQMMARQFIPPAFVLSLLTCGVVGIFWKPAAWLFLLIAGAYLLANLAASAWCAARRGWKYLLLLPFVFAILHFGYGVGFLCGLVRFANRWGDRHGKTPGFQDAISSSEQI
jgi:succinoglycan biosynthesis protein ExoA